MTDQRGGGVLREGVGCGRGGQGGGTGGDGGGWLGSLDTRLPIKIELLNILKIQLEVKRCNLRPIGKFLGNFVMV